MIGVTIRMGAAHYDITTPDGQVWDLAAMTPRERNKTRHILVGVYEQHLESTKGNA